jgi:predicted RNA methylase
VKVSDDVIQVLARVHTDGDRLTIPGPRLDARLYQRVNEVLEAVGGRWTTNAGAHLFPTDAAAAIAPVLATRQVVTLREKRQQAQYFPTPKPVVQRLLELAQLQPGMEILEPSAGSGAIAAAAAAHGCTVDCIERDPGYAAVLADTGTARTIRVADFLSIPADHQYDRVVMNPPFTKGADIQHVQHALRFLKPGGLLVAVMSWAVTQQTSRTAAFRALVEARGGAVEAVPQGAFAESGTDVDTVLVTIPATRLADVEPVVWPVREAPAESEQEFRDPAEILQEIRASLLESLRIFDELAKDLSAPPPGPEAARPSHVTPVRTAHQEQLLLDGLDKAS